MSYDPTNPVHGRAQVPGSGGDGGVPGNGNGPAASGRAQVGRASIPRPPLDPSDNPGAGYGTGSAGYATPGRASVPGGRASVRGAAPVRGAARVPSYANESDLFDNGGGQPPSGGEQGFAHEPPEPHRKPPKKGKWRRRRNLLIASIVAVVLMLGGAGLIAGTYFFDNVELPENIYNLKQSTTIYYADGKTEMAKIGAENRSLVTIDKIPKHVQYAVVGAEDNSFYTNNGVDYKGIVRAIWNNSTGGEKQGASTITQQYARNILDMKEISYGRKLREAVLAMKLSKQYDKDKILEMYLNTVFFGRQAYGIQAASMAYFNKGVEQLSVAEGMVLAAVIKQPTSTDGNGGSPYDPTTHPDLAGDRFNYIKNNMVKLKFISQQEADALKLPDSTVQYGTTNTNMRTQWGLDTPTGLVVHHVMDELSRQKLADGTDRFPDLRNSGMKIITTIDKPMQDAAVAAADPDGATFKSFKYKNPEKLQSALVAVEAGTGRVKAYYGGARGDGTDYAGVYQDPVLGSGKWSAGGSHQPGSTMKVYTLATALMNNYSVNSIWDGTKKEFPELGRGKNNPISTGNPGCGTACTLAQSATDSLNSPFFAVAALLGPEKVVKTAKDAGIRYMWGNDGVQYDLNKLTDKASITQHFSAEVGFGQFPITPLEHANGIATIANRGAAATEHFVDKVLDRSGNSVYAGPVAAKQVPGLTPAMTDAMNPPLEDVVTHYKVKLNDNRDAAGKSGTWQLGKTGGDNAHAWFVGYTASDVAKNNRGIATAVWLGSRHEEEPLKFANGDKIIGGEGAGPIWKAFMNAALKGVKTVKFPEAKDVGAIETGNGKAVEVPSMDPSAMFPDPNGNNNGGWPGNNNGNNNGNNGPGNNGPGNTGTNTGTNTGNAFPNRRPVGGG